MRRRLLAALLALLGAAAQAQERPLIVGVALPKAGLLADVALEAGQGLELWLADVNAAGGLLGRRVELRREDDATDAGAVRAAYERLIDEARADVLIGPAGSAATLVAGVLAERRRRVMLNATGAESAVHKQGYRYLFQVPPPVAEQGANALALAHSVGVKALLLHTRGSDAGASERLRADAARLGLGIVTFDATGTSGYPAIIERARAAQVEGWIALVPGREAGEIVKAFKAAAYAPGFFLAEGAGQPQFVREVGQDAEFALGMSPYEPGLRTPGNARFVEAYRAKHRVAPGRIAAGAYAAGQVLEAAVRAAGSVEQEALRDALARLRTDTLFGTYAVDELGAQTGAKPFVVQILKGRREVVWPPEYASARPVLPYPGWGERVIIKR